MLGMLSKGDKLFGIITGVWLIAAATAVVALPPMDWFDYSARLLFFHIPMAWIAVLAFLMGAWWAFQYLRSKDLSQFHHGALSNRVGLVFTLLATVSGAVYGKLTWGTFWNWDIRQTTIFILLLIYAAYIVLGHSIEDEEKKARISAVYSLFAFVTVPFLFFVIPRLGITSIHPTTFSMDTNMVLVLVTALLGITACYIWIMRCGAAYRKEKKKLHNLEILQNREDQE